MALVARQFYLVVLNNVLLYNRVADLLDLALSVSLLIEISLRDESGVAWNITSSLCCTDVEGVDFDFLLSRFSIKLVSWIMAVYAQGAGILTLEKAAS